MIREYSLRNCSCDGVLRLRQWSEWGKKDSEMYVPSAACWSVEPVEVSEPVLSVLPVEVSEPEVSLEVPEVKELSLQGGLVIG